MTADKQLTARLTACQTTTEALDAILGEMDKLGYTQAVSYVALRRQEWEDEEVER